MEFNNVLSVVRPGHADQIANLFYEILLLLPLKCRDGFLALREYFFQSFQFTITLIGVYNGSVNFNLLGWMIRLTGITLFLRLEFFFFNINMSFLLSFFRSLS
jgi:hypothetical protein